MWGESPDLDSGVKQHCVTSCPAPQATVTSKGSSPLSVMDGEEDQVTPMKTRPAPKMNAWCEGEHPSQRTVETSGGEGKASTAAAAAAAVVSCKVGSTWRSCDLNHGYLGYTCNHGYPCHTC